MLRGLGKDNVRELSIGYSMCPITCHKQHEKQTPSFTIITMHVIPHLLF